MNIRLVSFLLAGLWVWSGMNAYCQDSRARQIEKRKEEKAKRLNPYVPNKVERIVTRLSRPRNGIFPVVGSAYSGGGFALGAGYQKLMGDRNFAEIHGLYSV